jgi:DNA transformation protein
VVLPDEADLALLPNLGEKSARMLRSVGVRTVGDLRGLGPVECFARLRLIGEKPSLVLLWAMVAGLRGEHWNSLPAEKREALRRRLDDEQSR